MAKNQQLITSDIENLIDKALVVVDNAQRRIASANKHGGGARTAFWLDLEETKKDIKALKKENFRKNSKGEVVRKAYIDNSKVEFLKQAANPRYYDKWIEYNLSYGAEQSKKSKKTGKTITDYVRERKWVSQKEINAIRRKEKAGTATPEEMSLLSSWQKATETANEAISTTVLPKLEEGIEATDEQKAQMIRARRNRRSLDLSIGGQSTLINDLSYFLGSKFKSEVIKEFIDWARKGMKKDKKFFAEIENLYHSRDIHQKIDEAKGANWYQQYKEIISALEELMHELENHYGDKIDFKEEFDRLHEEVETRAMEGI